MKKVSHININCSNLYTSIQFYNNLGFQINGNILEEKATKKILLQKKSTFKGEQNPALLLIEYLISNDNGTNTYNANNTDNDHTTSNHVHNNRRHSDDNNNAYRTNGNDEDNAGGNQNNNGHNTNNCDS